MTENIQIYKDRIFKAFLNGARAVIRQENKLNEINVFPVKDADTGSNLRSLMDSIISTAKVEATLKETLESISNAALIGSKGNSGLIFSQFFYGLSKDIEVDYLDQQILKEQIKKGYEFAYEAINMPVEGTMITLMRNWYNLLSQDTEQSISFESYLMQTNLELQKSLNETKNILPILRKYNVVDAGALAFTTFVDGFIRSITDDNFIVEVTETKQLDLDTYHHFDEHDQNNINHRYCTEILIKTPLEKDSLKRLLDHHGDSLVIGKSSEFYKIHIHTNEPDKVLEYVSKYASIVDSKVDDMKNQYMLNHAQKHNVCILTDSISDIHSTLIDEFQIQVFPVSINVDGTIYFDKKSIRNQRILELIQSSESFPRSASPSIISVIKQLEFLKKVYQKILVITVSSQMSSIYNVFKNAISKLKDEDIVLIDSKQNSVSEGLIALHAAKMAAANKDFAEIVKSTKRIVDNSNILVKVQSLDNMIRSGRISRGLGFIAKMLNLKPIVSIDTKGEGIVLSKAFGRKNSLKKILNHIKKINRKEGIVAYAISYVDDRKEAERLKASLVRILGFLPKYVTESSSVIAMNAGKSAVAVGYIKGSS